MRRVAIGAALGSLLITLSAVKSRGQANFFQGKTIKFVVGYQAGDSHDLWARAYARHMGKHIPGNPTFIVQNMTGAGSMVAANFIYNLAKPDGLTMGTFAPADVIERMKKMLGS
jgi:tripartite-type tricarboxylate transporter receptor subunit TctC